MTDDNTTPKRQRFAGADRVDEFVEDESTESASQGATEPRSRRRFDKEALWASYEMDEPEPQPPVGRWGRKPSAKEVAAYEAELRAWETKRGRRRMQSGWTRPMKVLIANTKGSSAKTPTALNLANAFHEALPGRVCVYEAGEAAGTLMERANGKAKLGQEKLLLDKDVLASPTRTGIENYAAVQDEGAVVFGAVRQHGRRGPFSADDVETFMDVFDTQYSVSVIDSANNEFGPAFGAALTATDALVIPMLYSNDSAMAVLEILDLISNQDPRIPFRPELWERTTVVMSRDRRAADAMVQGRFAKQMRADGLTVVEVPFDPHIDEGRELVWSRHLEDTRHAYRQAAWSVAEHFTQAENDETR